MSNTDLQAEIERLRALLATEHAQRITLQHHAADLAQAMADMQKNIQYLDGLRHGWSAHAADQAQRAAGLEAEVERITEAGRAHIRRAAAFEAQRDDLAEALVELRDRIRGHPAYADLTEDEEMRVGGDTAELSYLARVADAALSALWGESAGGAA